MNSAPIKPLISTPDLNKIDVRIGTILASRTWRIRRCSHVCLSISATTRSILVSMKKQRPYPKEIEGRQALSVVTLAPRMVAGEVSEGRVPQNDLGRCLLSGRKRCESGHCDCVRRGLQMTPAVL